MIGCNIGMLVLLVVVFLQLVNGGNVLFGGMHASRSHISSMLPFAKKLSAENHSAHFMETYTLPKPYNFHPSIVPHPFKLPGDEMYARQVLGLMWTRTYGPEVMVQLYTVGDNAFLHILREYPDEFNELINGNFNLTVVDELFGLAAMGIALKQHDQRGTPFIIQSTTTTIHGYTWEMGLGRPLIHRPSMWFPNGDDLHYNVEEFRIRLLTVIHGVQGGLTSVALPQRYSVNGMSEIGIHDFSFFKLWNSMAFNMLEDITSLAFPAPISNAIKNVGRTCNTPGILNEEFRAFVDDPSSKGTVLIAFGTNVLWEFAPQYVVDAFFNTVNGLTDYRVVFAYNGPKPNRTVGAHVKLTTWSPQLELLSHPKTKVYITHGGLKSVKEAICTRTPLVVFPLFAEQTLNAANALKMGFARSLNKYTVTEEKLYEAVVDVIEDQKYAKAVQKFNRMFTDLPIKALDEGAFYAKRAMRSKEKSPYFKIEGAKLTWFESFLGCYIVLFTTFWVFLSF